MFLRPSPSRPLQHTAMFSHVSLTASPCTSVYALSAADSFLLLLAAAEEAPHFERASSGVADFSLLLLVLLLVLPVALDSHP